MFCFALKNDTTAAPAAWRHEMKAEAAIAHANVITERNVIPLSAFIRAKAVISDLPKRSDGLSFAWYGAGGHLVAPRPHPSSLESSNYDQNYDSNGSFLAYMPLSPPVLQESPERAGMLPPWAI